MDPSNRAKVRLGLLLGGLAMIFLLLLFQLARHPATALLLVALPAPAALACNIRCVGLLPFLQVVGEGGRSLLLIALSGSFLYAFLRMTGRILLTWGLIDRAERRAVLPQSLPELPFRDGITVFEGPALLAFTAGFIKPKIYVSQGLVESLSHKELSAVIKHESHHRESRDPLKGLLISFIRDFLFFLPVSRLLKNAYHMAEEMTADAGSVREPAEASDLAASLLRVRQLSGAGASTFFDPVLARARNLTGEPSRISLPLRKLALAVLFLAISVFIVMVPIRKSVTDMFLDHDKVCVLNTGRR